MKTITFEVRSLADTLADFTGALESGVATEPRIAFQTSELLLEVLTLPRWNLLSIFRRAGPMNAREAAQRMGRDLSTVDEDILVLFRTGILRKTDAGKYEFPFDAVHVDFMLRTA